MKNGKWKEYWRNIQQKNIILTVLAFLIGIILQLTDTTIILLIISVAIISTWWQWRPYPINAESKLILDTLKKHPAVLIKNYAHIIAFNSRSRCLAAAYQSPVPRTLLKRALPNHIDEIEGLEIIISQMGAEVFLLLKIPLNPYTRIKEVFQTFRSVIGLLELQLQAKFHPAERYQTVRLFGLENYLPKSEQPSAELKQKKPIECNTGLESRSIQASTSDSGEIVSLSFTHPFTSKSKSLNIPSRDPEPLWVISIGEVIEGEVQAVFAKQLSLNECLDLSLVIKDHTHSFQPRRGSRFQEPIRLFQDSAYYLIMFQRFNSPIKGLVWLCIHEKAISALIEDYERLYSIIEAFLQDSNHLSYEDLRAILGISEQMLKKPIASRALPKNQDSLLKSKKVSRVPFLLES
ncbi:MAG: hypothetical protein ACFFC7_23365 [Candidatus Hermodarchaeota archaeon]